MPRLAGRVIRPGSIRPGGFACQDRPFACQGRPFSHSQHARAETCWKVANLYRTRRLVSIAGPDAARYLQGALTADVTKLASPAPSHPPFTSTSGPGARGIYAAFLSAQGRVLYDVFLYRDTLGVSTCFDNASPEDSFLIDVDGQSCEDLVEHIERYKLRAKFKTRVVGDCELYHVWEDNAPPQDAAYGSSSQAALAESFKELLAGAPAITLPDARAPNHGYRVITAGRHHGSPFGGISDHDEMETEYCQRRHVHGIAENRNEILYGKGLPQESNLDCMGAIDWAKGCYVGQELTIRTKHRGVVRKRILPCMLYPEGDPIPRTLEPTRMYHQVIPAGTSIEPLNKAGRSAAKWLHGVGNIGVALCRLETMTGVVLPGATTPSSYSPGDEFTTHMVDAKDKRKIMVKAFVPDWLRACINA